MYVFLLMYLFMISTTNFLGLEGANAPSPKCYPGCVRHILFLSLSSQSALKSVKVDKDRLAEEVQNLAGLTGETENLSQQLTATKQQLLESQVRGTDAMPLSSTVLPPEGDLGGGGI